MHELDQLIEKFWTGRTTEAENQRLLELLEKEGDDHRQRILAAFGREDLLAEHKIGEEKARQLLTQIHTRYDIDQSAPPRIPWLRRYGRTAAVAACLLVLAGVALIRNKRPVTSPTINTVAQAAPARLIQLSNTSDTTMTVALKDGSVIQLQTKSGISYYEPFINDRRDISLLGTALFKVAKDKARPFSVYAGGTVTRVLGTRFVINAGNGPKVTVRLLEGSIAVIPRQSPGPAEKEILLKTGQEIAVSRLDHSYTVSTVPPAVNNTARDHRDDHGLAFNKEPLKQVFRKIGSTYGITFSYDPKEMNGLYFTGTFLRSDELNSMLATICNVNDLSFEREGDTVRIKKLH
jgi:ferric-dicitrate binding protein FerR (iron transport regulator)